ncbi:WD40-repeat-containing domain protein [Suillus subalutaceus]|uniref:WD40-repeat-containing domain protein n=1 Tax=Suillus subalutaceus TaxID=48586 RepID=UPI001B85D059|nr:WD40-repeat-containing domain protein [Suillus subalutaceus]KAG1829225.1 WD40-repeat-containing domain protein [Suillus subalutaceus]
MSQLIPSTTTLRTFKGHQNGVTAVAVFSDKRRMVTASYDRTLRLWDLKTGAVLKKMEGHSSDVFALTVSRDGQMIASGDSIGEVIAWHGETGQSLTQPIKTNCGWIYSADFTPDGTVLVIGGTSIAVKFWCTKTWQLQGEPIECGAIVFCVRYSPSGELLAIATTQNIQIYNPGTRERIASFGRFSKSLVWTPDGTRLLSGSDKYDPTIRELDPLTWQRVGHPWKGHTDVINAIAIHPAGILVASTADDNHVRRRVSRSLWTASTSARHDQAAIHFTAAVNASAFSSNFMPQLYEDLTVLFGWDLQSLCFTAHQKRCQAFLSAGKPDEALEAHKYMMDAIDETAKASCVDWSNGKFSIITLAAHDDRILGAEIPGQDQDRYDVEPNFFRGMQEYSHISRPRPQQRPGHLKRVGLALTRSPRPPPAPPTTPPPVAIAATSKTRLRHLFTRPPHHTTHPIIEVPFAKGKERNAAADAPGKDPDIVPYEYQDLDTTQPDPNTRQQQQAVTVHIDPGEHGGGKSCVCC